MGMGGNDTFVFTTTPNTTTNDVTITDFSVAKDLIELSHAIYGALAPGALPSTEFVIGSAATNATSTSSTTRAAARCCTMPTATAPARRCSSRRCRRASPRSARRSSR
jgi:hypothetical protein